MKKGWLRGLQVQVCRHGSGRRVDRKTRGVPVESVNDALIHNGRDLDILSFVDIESTCPHMIKQSRSSSKKCNADDRTNAGENLASHVPRQPLNRTFHLPALETQ